MPFKLSQDFRSSIPESKARLQPGNWRSACATKWVLGLGKMVGLFLKQRREEERERVRGTEGDSSGSLRLWILTAGYLWAALSSCAYGVITSRVKYFNCQWLWLISLSTLTSALWDVLPGTSSCGMSPGIFGMPRGSRGTTDLVWGKKAGCLRFKFHIHPRHREPCQPRNGC